MARIQILELPMIDRGDDGMETPFVVIIDSVSDPDSMHENLARLPGLREALGARAVLIFEEPVEIPANEVPVDPDGYPLKIHVEGDFEQFREQVQDEIRKAQAKIIQVVNQT
jgi:flagellar motor protein MotB